MAKIPILFSARTVEILDRSDDERMLILYIRIYTSDKHPHGICCVICVLKIEFLSHLDLL